MPQIYGIPPMSSATVGGIGTKSKILDLTRCDRCGFSFPGDECNFPHCPSKIIAAAKVVTRPAVDDTRYSGMVRLEQTASRLLATDRKIGCVYSSELPPEFIMADAVCGVTGLGLHLALREHLPFLEAVDRCIIFNSANIQAEYGRGTKGQIEVFLHELAHIACGGFRVDDPREPEKVESIRVFNELQLLAPPIAAYALDTYEQHPLAFWRAATHLVSRAYSDGLEFDVCNVHERYGLDAEVYHSALRDEIEAFDNMPLIEALGSSDPPQEFTDLFEADVARVRSQH